MWLQGWLSTADRSAMSRRQSVREAAWGGWIAPGTPSSPCVTPAAQDVAQIIRGSFGQPLRCTSPSWTVAMNNRSSRAQLRTAMMTPQHSINDAAACTYGAAEYCAIHASPGTQKKE